MTKENNQFSDEVSKKLGYYVYRLIDPRNGDTFYVGKGIGNRIFAHALNASADVNSDNHSDKIQRIIDIQNAGLEVIHVIHRHGLKTEDEAFEVEAALIDVFPGLTNMQRGHRSTEFGPMSPSEIMQKYALPPFPDLSEKAIFLNVNNLENRSDKDAIYRQVRCAWRVNKERAAQADIVIAVVKGVAVGVFENGPWIPATVINFPTLESDIEGRWGFVGEISSEEKWSHYIGDHGKRILQEHLEHEQNPVRYSY